MTSVAELNSDLKIPKEILKEQVEHHQILPPLRNFTKPNNNNRHVVTFGIIIVLFTLYITAASIRNSNENIDTDIEDREDQNNLRNLQEKEIQRQAKILEKLQEHEHICSELEIFIKEFKWSEKITNDPNKLKQNSIQNEKKRNVKSDNEKDTINNTTKISFKNLNKNLEKNKKEQTKKKSSTAEPIIYLFALVFIYLLLKAASDINQHYKSQAKGDKRLRRCSLQSYAQTHKQDRRASKDKSLTATHRHERQHFLEQRSQSFDRPPKLKLENSNQKFDFNLSLKENKTVGGLTGNIVDKKGFNAGDILITDLSVSQSRRCSVPANPKSLPPDMCRRTSIVYGSNTGVSSLAGSIENVDLQFSENKRRVRMINRH